MKLNIQKNSNCLVGLYMDNITKEELLSACLYTIAEQTNNVDVVIVTHGLSDQDKTILSNVTQNPYYPVVTQSQTGETKVTKTFSTKPLNFAIVEVEKTLGVSAIFNEILNIAVDNGYETMSFVEQEDSFSLKWFEIAKKYQSENPEIAIFLPLTRNTINGAFTNLMNEGPWAENMAEEAGKADINMLMRFNCINPLGAFYSIKSIIDHSEKKEINSETRYLPMKESIKYSHYYEFFLRMIYNDLKAMTVPRIGYELNVVRKDIYTDSSCKLPTDITSFPPERGGITQQEGGFWFDLAKKEYFFDEDRNKVYQQPTTA